MRLYRCMTSLKQTTIGTFFVVMSIASCRGGQESGGSYLVFGSETWFDIMNGAINAAREKNVDGAGELLYLGGGSGLAEINMLADCQSIGPMSRNLNRTILEQKPSWAPALRNVVGLDALVVVAKNTQARCKNISLPLDPSNPDLADENISIQPFVFGQSGSGYTQILQVILAGVDGSGSVKACSSPRRLQAVQDLAACQGVGTLSHVYRPDDNAGTAALIRHKLRISRFCNGQAPGVINPDLRNPNFSNQDFDPIRRPCPSYDPILINATSCTDMTTGLACNHEDGNPNCTQGLVVALSIPDPAATDIAGSIALRIQTDPGGGTLGLASRKALQNPAVSAPFLNTNSYSDTLVRLDQYLFSARLYFHHGPDILDRGTSLFMQGGGDQQRQAELNLFAYLTESDETRNPSGSPGRCNLDPILQRFNLIPCTTSCMDTLQGSSNLCAKEPYLPAKATLQVCLPNVDQSIAGWGYEEVHCTPGSICCSTGEHCPENGLCPRAGNLVKDSPCTKDEDCEEYLRCKDWYTIGTNVCG